MAFKAVVRSGTVYLIPENLLVGKKPLVTQPIVYVTTEAQIPYPPPPPPEVKPEVKPEVARPARVFKEEYAGEASSKSSKKG